MADPKMPTHVMGVSLLHKCNFSCEHCGYIYIGAAEDHIIRPGYRLTWNQIMAAINDCVSLENSYWNLNYTGGEPTLWQEDDKDLMDILIATARAKQLPTYNTNGSYFDDPAKTYEFFKRYLDHADTPLKTFISMDKFHKNYDPKTCRAKSLDVLTDAWTRFNEDQRKLLSVHVIIIVTRDPDSSLPEEMKKHYGATGITFGDFPMMEIGKAKNLKEQLPDPPDFGPMIKNKENGPPGLVLVGEDYYFRDKKIGKLGHMLDLYPKSAKNQASVRT
jgi:MoaA/NifB/PqqE/SkfB family radical SAM enzyme